MEIPLHNLERGDEYQERHELIESWSLERMLLDDEHELPSVDRPHWRDYGRWNTVEDCELIRSEEINVIENDIMMITYNDTRRSKIKRSLMADLRSEREDF